MQPAVDRSELDQRGPAPALLELGGIVGHRRVERALGGPDRPARRGTICLADQVEHLAHRERRRSPAAQPARAPANRPSKG